MSKRWTVKDDIFQGSKAEAGQQIGAGDGMSKTFRDRLIAKAEKDGFLSVEDIEAVFSENVETPVERLYANAMTRAENAEERLRRIETAIDGGRFSEWPLSEIIAQCRMQSRDNLDPGFSDFMAEVANRLAIRSEQNRVESVRHEFVPNKKYPWFCAHCGYAPQELLMHLPSDPCHDPMRGMSHE